MRRLHHYPVRTTFVGVGHAVQDREGYRLRDHLREGRNMSITRRHLTMVGALALGGAGLWRKSSAVAASADEAAVAAAVEALRKAMLGQEKAQLEALTADQLSYGHSDGRVENKAQFIEGVMNRKAILKSLTWSDHTIAIVGTDAIAGIHGRPKAKWTANSRPRR